VTGDGAEDIVRSYLASFATADPEVIAAHVAREFVNEHASALGAGSVGRDTYRARLPGFLASFPGIRYEVVSVVGGTPADGDCSVAVEYRLIATSDGHPIDLPGVMVFAVRDGLIARRTDYWDALPFLRQVGAAPPASSPG
jgi:ketosteroid isomerase-like protein